MSTSEQRPRGVDRTFGSFASWLARWIGSHWAFMIAAVLVLVVLVVTDVAMTNLLISIVTLLMVFVLQNTQNRHSAALHLKLDEMVRAEPDARNEVRGAESKSEREILQLTREDADAPVSSTGG